jgi:hypothetical protein
VTAVTISKRALLTALAALALDVGIQIISDDSASGAGWGVLAGTLLSLACVLLVTAARTADRR